MTISIIAAYLKQPAASTAVPQSSAQIDTTQDVARAYDAQCTPDFFGLNAQDELQYRRRLDASRITPVPNARRDLFEAMKQIADTGQGPDEQFPSMGCSIKWKR